MRALAVLLALGLAGCQGAPQNGPQSAIPNEVGIGTRSTFAIATPAGPVGLDAAGKNHRRLPALPQRPVPRAPAPPPPGRNFFRPPPAPPGPPLRVHIHHAERYGHYPPAC